MDLTIIIPTRNRATYVLRTLKSIEHSTLMPKEVIIVDNGSTDDTVSICEKYIASHKAGSNGSSPLYQLVHQPKPGAASARNKGLEACKTEWVFFFDSDDEIGNDFVETISGLDYHQYEMIAVPTNMIVNGRSSVRAYSPTSDTKTQVLSGMLNTQSMVFRTEFLRRIGGWSDNCMIWNDWELGVRALANKPRLLWFTKKAFHTIYVHGDSITGTSFTSNYKKLINTLNVASSYLKDEDLKALYYRCGILIGKIEKEKHVDRKEAINALNDFVSKTFTPTAKERLAFTFLQLYSQYGGRGAWRIALHV